ncbi:hypothetical protein MXB_710 [Myxobolus squamalis]|nr:hypothetical protein MXB_710 [Myxobolus squamalis]
MSGMQLHRISIDVESQSFTVGDHATEEQENHINDALATFFKGAHFGSLSHTVEPEINESTDEIKIAQVNTLNESIDILTDQGNSDSDTSVYQKLTDTSIIEEEAGNVDSTHYLSREILDNVIYLQKFIDQSLDTFNGKLMAHFSYQFDELRQKTDMRSQNSVVAHLKNIENRLKCLEENHILLLRKIDDYHTLDGGKSTLNNIEKSLNSNGVQDACTLLTPQFKQSLGVLLNDIAKQKLEEILVEKISTFVQAEFKSLFGTINNVFYNLSSVGKHIDELVNAKTLELNQPSDNKDELIKLIANIQENLTKSFHESLEYTCQKLEQNMYITVTNALKSPDHRPNGDIAFNMSENFQKIFDELLLQKKYCEALEYCCGARNFRLLMQMLNITSPRDLFNRKNEIPVSLIIQFITWISDEDVSITNEVLFKHIFESLLLFTFNHGSVDLHFYTILSKLEQKLSTLISIAGTEIPVITMVLHIIESISLVI